MGATNHDKAGTFKRAMAWVCHACPICRYGREHPESLLGKILHHDIHARHCPMWKAEKTVYQPD
jgi:hypothetical protein